MSRSISKQLWVIAVLLAALCLVSGANAQKNKRAKAVKAVGHGTPVMWQKVNIAGRDLFMGPGGEAGQPDLSRIKFIKQEKGGHNKKYRISDGSGRIWVAKLGREAQPETVAVRLLWGIGYVTEINYLVPSITIPGKGTFKNVRLEARPDNIERLEEWKWKDNPFIGTRELQGLKMMMVFMCNWDVLDLQNQILQVGNERHYIVSDLGSTFGRLGNNNFPVIYRFGRRTNSPKAYVKTRFIRDVDDGIVELSYKGKNRKLFKGITVADARWLANLLGRLSDRQIRDAFRAANYTPGEIDLYFTAVKNKIGELQNAAGDRNLALDGQ